MKPSRELIAVAAAVVVMAVAVAVVVVVTVVAVIATTIVTNANHAGSKNRPRIYTDQHGLNYLRVTHVKIRGYFLASALSFRLSFSVPRTTSTTYSSPAFISPSAAV